MANGIVPTSGACRTPAPPTSGSARQWTDGRGAAGVLATTLLYHRWRSRRTQLQSRPREHDLARAPVPRLPATPTSRSTRRSISRTPMRSRTRSSRTSRARAATRRSIRSRAICSRSARRSHPVRSTAYPVEYYRRATPITGGRRTSARRCSSARQAAGLAGLGQAIADDPRFARCTAIRFAVVHHPDAAEPAVAGMGRAAAAGVRRQARLQREAAREGDRPVRRVPRLARHRRRDAPRAWSARSRRGPNSSSRMFADLTGFTWIRDVDREAPPGHARSARTNLLASDFVGFRVLAGGIDSYFVTEPGPHDERDVEPGRADGRGAGRELRRRSRCHGTGRAAHAVRRRGCHRDATSRRPRPARASPRADLRRARHARLAPRSTRATRCSRDALAARERDATSRVEAHPDRAC